MSENDAREKLEPCPRCGGHAFVTQDFGVWCSRDRCLTLPPRKDRAEAITAWNTRATAHPEPTADAPGEVERMAEALYSRDREGWLEKHPDDSFVEWKDVSLEAFKDQWRDEARAALTALRPQSPDAVALLRRVRDRISDRGNLQMTLAEIDQFLQSEGA